MSINTLVLYNGGEGSYLPVDDPKLLQTGAQYTVIAVEETAWFTYVELKEVPGKRFNSVWFTPVDQQESRFAERKSEKIGKPVYVALGLYVPKVGNSYRCMRLKNLNLEGIQTSMVLSVERIDKESATETYKVETKNSIYYVQIQKYERR